MSNGMIIFLAFLSFIVLNGFVDALRERASPSKREREAAVAKEQQLTSMDVALQDIRQRLASIEGILQQVE